MGVFDLEGDAVVYCWIRVPGWRLTYYIYSALVLAAVLVLLLRSRRLVRSAIAQLEEDGRMISQSSGMAESASRMVFLFRGVLLAQFIW